MLSDPNSHLFSSSSVVTYSKEGDEPPKVFQASSQTRCAPGGVSPALKHSHTSAPPADLCHDWWFVVCLDKGDQEESEGL